MEELPGIKTKRMILIHFDGTSYRDNKALDYTANRCDRFLMGYTRIATQAAYISLSSSLI
ncbi:uncharacterized protein PHALS_15181 [Plasmopara halstedii]|uniref:Uncharacterized protein n=1 Tax=Plasmopara halstedii TaxID=4781 RepID=A0A0P1B2D8_PLAHL|nr:uncharacterized protein PHALS_15181 [Plasmopara halstedii]CEG48904.1 hypothetical protein PHALS_15181 [Plasmopara halstedii]|eukprot:XP_024585273.1 hypothetical protein PHALS_15181 [Plasmopara halstedii]